MHRNRWVLLATVVFLGAFSAPRADASVIRFHYAAADLCGNTSLKPSGPNGALGTRTAWFGLYREPFNYPVRPTHVVTFWHPYAQRYVMVPLALPEGTPRVEHIRNAVRFNYGSYAVDVQFLPDGSADVVYRNGFLARG